MPSPSTRHDRLRKIMTRERGAYTNDNLPGGRSAKASKIARRTGEAITRRRATSRLRCRRAFGRRERRTCATNRASLARTRPTNTSSVPAATGTAGAYYIYDVAADTMTKLADLCPGSNRRRWPKLFPSNTPARRRAHRGLPHAARGQDRATPKTPSWW